LNVLLFHENDELAPGRVRVTDRRHRHVREILRARVGDALLVGRIDGLLGRGTIVALDEHALDLDVTLDVEPPPPLPITLALALPRPPSLRKVLQQATALGVKRFVLFASARVERATGRARGSSRRRCGRSSCSASSRPSTRSCPRFASRTASGRSSRTS
jgi:RsmE family RNA methyltransferase